jgi:type VI secretion system protein ImpJ
MFLRPQHLQAAHRHLAHLLATNARWDNPYNWGLRRFELDAEALANHRFLVRALQVRFRDGTVVSVPEDGMLPTLELKSALQSEPTITVSVAIPVLQLGHANQADEKRNANGRYRVSIFDLEDENSGLHPRPVQLRRPNLRLLLSTDDPAGYESVPVARLEKSPEASGIPRIHTPYIPPLLACSAWTPLSAGIIEALFDRISRKSDLLAQLLTARGITLDSHAQGDALLVSQMRSLNEAAAVLKNLAMVQWIHPLIAYMELIRLVGQLAIFSDSRRLPVLPDYDHDDLAGCFYQIKIYLDALLDRLVEPGYKQRPFEGVGQRMQVTLEPAWLEAGWDLYVGVKSTIPAQERIGLLVRGRLDMKIGSSERVDRIFDRGGAGLTFAYIPTPPRALPSAEGLIYLQVNRDADEWQHVQKSLSLAIRLNENHVAGSIDGQRVLTIRRAGGQTGTMDFTLYVLKAER